MARRGELAGIGIAWLAQWPLLFWAALVIGFEKASESSFAVAALKQEQAGEGRRPLA